MSNLHKNKNTYFIRSERIYFTGKSRQIIMIASFQAAAE